MPLSDGITNNDAIYDAASRFEVPSQYVYSLLSRERLIGKFDDLMFDGRFSRLAHSILEALRRDF
jgi:hypothetical protein